MPVHLSGVLFQKFGSEREFDKSSISCGFGESDEFGFGDRHTLSLEEQAA
jgi:hypothetical protein